MYREDIKILLGSENWVQVKKWVEAHNLQLYLYQKFTCNFIFLSKDNRYHIHLHRDVCNPDSNNISVTDRVESRNGRNFNLIKGTGYTSLFDYVADTF